LWKIPEVKSPIGIFCNHPGEGLKKCPVDPACEDHIKCSVILSELPLWCHLKCSEIFRGMTLLIVSVTKIAEKVKIHYEIWYGHPIDRLTPQREQMALTFQVIP